MQVVPLSCCAAQWRQLFAYRLHICKTDKERLVSEIRFEAVQTLLGRTTQQ